MIKTKAMSITNQVQSVLIYYKLSQSLLDLQIIFYYLKIDIYFLILFLRNIDLNMPTYKLMIILLPHTCFVYLIGMI